MIVVTTRAAARAATQALESAGAEVIRVQGSTDAERVRAALDELGQREVLSVLLEGGPRLAGAFFDSGEVDEMRLFIAPVVVGGASARDPLEGEGVEQISEATRALSLECTLVAGDALLIARVREW